MKITFGISPCPNDTYVYHALLNKIITTSDLEIEFILLDIQQLNEAVLSDNLDFAKVSFAVAGAVKSTYRILPVGAALGFGVGPIIVGKDAKTPNTCSSVVCPGAYTTATLLFKRFFPAYTNIAHARFSEISDLVARGVKDLGVLIHEGRFTYTDQDLHLIADLGDLWERRYQVPVPLGGLVAKRSIPNSMVRTVINLVQQSIRYSEGHRKEALVTMRKYAQEFDDIVLWKHVELYVNAQTMELNDKGREAIEVLLESSGSSVS